MSAKCIQCYHGTTWSISSTSSW